MSGSKHDKGESPFTDDLERNPGIGGSEGAFATGEKPERAEGDNTFEGDVENDPQGDGSVSENQLGRTNS